MQKSPKTRLRRNRGKHTMNMLLWVLQVLAAFLYGASGVMKVFMFDKVSEGSRPLVRCRGKLGWPSASSNSSAQSG